MRRGGRQTPQSDQKWKENEEETGVSVARGVESFMSRLRLIVLFCEIVRRAEKVLLSIYLPH